MDRDLVLSLIKEIGGSKMGLYPECGFQEPYTLMRFFSQYTHALKYVIHDYLEDPDRYVFQYKTTVNGKAREIVTYRLTAEGQTLRNIHRRFSLVLYGIYKPHPQSYAYQQGKSIDLCLKRHLRSDTFLKTDIHAYFDSISYDLLLDRMLPFCAGVKRRENAIRTILSACFYRGRLPIGFVTSPILSDIYLRDLDEKMGALKGVHYTRYADDFIISASGEQAKDRLADVLNSLQEEIEKHSLALNRKKTYLRTLNAEGDAIHLLGLNVVKTGSGANRITVSQRYITETSKQIGFLLLNRGHMEPWELRRKFVTAMGRVSFIVHSSKDSALKLKKLLRVKTGYDGSLTYKALFGALLDSAAFVRGYEQEKQIETYMRIKHIRIFPVSGRVWERASIPAGSQEERNLLRRHLFSVCREFERPELGRIRVNRLSLTVGDESFSFHAPWDTKSFRALIRKIRTEPSAVSYSADYLYDNGEPVGLAKYGQYYFTTQSWFRPLIAQRTIGTCMLYSERENRWLFDRDGSTVHGKAVFEKASVSDFLERESWEGSVSFDLRWPFIADEEISKEIRLSLERAGKILAPWLKEETPDGDSGSFTHQFQLRTDAKTLVSAVESLQELSSLAKQAHGVNRVEAWFVPAGFLEAEQETRLLYISVSTEYGRFALRKFEG